MKPFYITTAISYVNGSPHLGHVYEMVSADFIARFKRLDGQKVFFLTGTDEHGQKIQHAAQHANIDIMNFCNMHSHLFKNTADAFYISYDRFIRTTELKHKKGVISLWNMLKKSDDIYLSSYAGWYSQRDESFVSEEEIMEHDNVKYSKITGAPLVYSKEPSYFFRLSKYQDSLLEFYEKNPNFISPKTRMNEIISFVKSGLQDISISRISCNWGIVVPENPEHTIYVWLDALTNYLTGVDFFDPEKKIPIWPADIHIVGKDLIRFHAVFWPAFLMSAKLTLPSKIFAHGFIKVHGEKMSKSIGNTVLPQDLLKTLDADSIRYTLLRDISYGEDGTFFPEQTTARVNADLSNNFGNLIQRVFSLIYNYNEKKIPDISNMTLEEDDKMLYKNAIHTYQSIKKLIKDYKIHRILEEIWGLITKANRYIDSQEPWVIRKNNHQRFQIVVYVLSDIIRIVSIMAIPVIPHKANAILDYLSIPDCKRSFKDLFCYSSLANIKISNPKPFFPK